MNARLLFTHALSPLHAGTGQGVGVIDLPIAREKATGIPYVPGSSLKGVLRESSWNKAKGNTAEEKNCEHVFGPPTDNADAFSGAAQFADQRLLCLPVRSLSGTFAWVTSPYLLTRFLRDAKDTGQTALIQPLKEITLAEKKCLVITEFSVNDSQVKTKLKLRVHNQDKVVLEDLDLELIEDSNATEWAKAIAMCVFVDASLRKEFAARFCVVPDNVLSFLLDTATEITARIKVREDVKTVQRGGLWYEEALPTETILYGFVLATPTGYHTKNGVDAKTIFDVIDKSIEPVAQLGGNATVGRGLCRLRLLEKQQSMQMDSGGSGEQQTSSGAAGQSATSNPIVKPLVYKPPA